MSKSYKKQDAPFLVPTEDGKIIKEHFGFASLGLALEPALARRAHIYRRGEKVSDAVEPTTKINLVFVVVLLCR